MTDNEPKRYGPYGAKRRAIRVPDELWAAALAESSDRGETVSAAVRRFLKRYTKT